MTPKQRAAAEKVIEAWEGPYYDSIEFIGGMRVAIDALREALAEPEQDVIQAAVLAEREACVEVCDAQAVEMSDAKATGAEVCAAAIRARSET